MSNPPGEEPEGELISMPGLEPRVPAILQDIVGLGYSSQDATDALRSIYLNPQNPDSDFTHVRMVRACCTMIENIRAEEKSKIIKPINGG